MNIKHGKSDITLDFLREKNIDPYVLTMGSGMTVDRMFGGLNLNVFNEEGRLEYLVENSFMNHEYVIFEEMLDAPDYILEELKDVLSSGRFRNGTQIFDIKTKYIICNTNKTREEFAKNSSLLALMERFPLEAEVKWKNYSKLTYEKLLNNTVGGSDPMLTFILEKYAKAGHIISPRIAIKSAELINQCGISCLEFIADFKKQETLLKDSIAAFQSIYKLREIGDKAKMLAENLTSMNIQTISDKDSFDQASKYCSDLFTEINKVSNLKVDDSLVKDKAEIKNTFTALHKEFQANLQAIEPLINF